MTRINITKTNPVFIAGVKAEVIAMKKRHELYLSIVKGTTKEATITKLKQIKVAY